MIVVLVTLHGGYRFRSPVKQGQAEVPGGVVGLISDSSVAGWVQTTESDATEFGTSCRDPIVELARLQWQEQQANDVVAEYLDDKLPALRKAKRNGDISKRDFEADERNWMVNVEGFEGIASASASAWDEHLAEMVAALPRPRRTELKPRIIAMADRHFNDAATQNRWHADQWSDHTFSWRVS